MIRLAIRRFASWRQVATAAIGLAALAVIAAAPSRAVAQMNSGSFTLKITEKEMKLEHPSDMMWDKYLMWDLAFQRMNDRNMPYIELANDATSTAPITELHITIGDNRFHFANDALGAYALVGSSTNEFSLTSSAINGDELVVNIGNGGLQPGDLVRFKIDLDVDAEYADDFFAHPDYRTVLFDMNGFNVYDGLQQQSSSDNSKVWAIFDPAVGANLVTSPVALQDEIVSGPAAEFYNDNYRRYNEMDPVRTFQIGGGGVIPEPSALALLGIGLLGGMVVGGRSRVVAETY